MSTATHQTRLFGLDLAPLWQATLAAWRDLLGGPWFGWLQPRLPVCLWTSEGQTLLSRGPATRAVISAAAARQAKFSALLLPEQLLLRTAVDLPLLPPDQCREALQLQAVTLSPFAPHDLVWAHEPATDVATTQPTLRHHLVLASRQLIAQHVMQAHQDLKLEQLEVWVPAAVPDHYLLLPGFTEQARLQRTRVWQRISTLLAVLAVILLLAIALTPSIQLYLRALQANQAQATLGLQAAPAIAARDKMVRAIDQLNVLKGKLNAAIPPAAVLKLLTEALPDDTSLLNLQIQELKVTLSGQTPDGASLMKRLGATPGLSNVTAPNPTVKPLGAARESFSIELTLDPKYFH